MRTIPIIKSINEQHSGAKVLNLQGTLFQMDIFKVGIALLTAVSLSG